MMRTAVTSLLLGFALSGCGDRLSPEERGDQFAALGNWTGAYEAWREAGDSPELLARRADAALQAGRLSAAALEYTRLGEADTSRADEAATGLTLAGTAAAREGDHIALAAVLVGLDKIAPGWPVGRMSMSLPLARFTSREDVLHLAPAVLAAAPARDVADDAILRWAAAEHERGDCPAALPLYGAVERRADGTISNTASLGVASCRLTVGILELEDREFSAATRSFEAAIQRDPDGSAGRRALVGLGDVHYQLGELYEAQLAWRTAASGAGSQDSITTLALERLRASEVVEDNPEPESP